MANNLTQLIKKCAMEAFRASKPSDYIVGKVVSLLPLKVQVSQQITLDEDFLLVTNTANNIICTGDKVLMIRKAGGKQYVIVDKVVSG
ncbi:DUF2577 domain-containing protein [[Clostridium] polysaccharolyticum]|uniref:DUF2577 domain-containing protein n=1 Tax=[Clostridium] polysaccharolyticum TaxID=29364 RepID=A0A1H9YIN5_9FIRM|nr:DUF2577 domain-containing protein [[Clostridium] polysaccharolyticum]SES68433.1 Protein of unknown function [[Clostridium] polysaccharolyticum]